MNQPSHNPQRFTNKVVIVTGAAQGIGQGVALQVAAEWCWWIVLTTLTRCIKKSLLRVKPQR